MNSSYLKYLIPVLLLEVGTAQAQLINGNFETGDLTGWTTFNTSHGGTFGPQVGSFDTAGTATPSLSAEFEVGETSGGIGGGGLGQGAGILQDLILGAGQLTIFLNIAAQSPGNNADGGTFELLLDGNVVASHAFGAIGFSQIDRSTLNYSGTVTAGTHEIAIDMRRGYGTGQDNTPFQYLDNIQLGGTAVPEPSAITLLSLALATLMVGRCRNAANGRQQT
jgi:hypothetical protein